MKEISMLVLRSFGTASVLAVALAMPALAQTKPAAVATASPLAAESTSATGTAHMAVTGPAGTLHKVHGMWRSSALFGATVYSDSGQAIGTISNLLIRSQGDVSGVVISVGGFLGIDNKLVELSFNQLKFEPSANSTTDRNETTVSGTSTPISRVSRAESEHPVADAAVSKSAYSVVLLGATKAMLTKMPAFTYHQQS
jgi:sporulation protein YlmC with PRC-barrel domain